MEEYKLWQMNISKDFSGHKPSEVENPHIEKHDGDSDNSEEVKQCDGNANGNETIPVKDTSVSSLSLPLGEDEISSLKVGDYVLVQTGEEKFKT